MVQVYLKGMYGFFSHVFLVSFIVKFARFVSSSIMTLALRCVNIHSANVFVDIN